MKTKVCTHCKKELPITSFRIHNKAKNEIYSICKICDREKRLKNYQEKKNYYRQKAIEWRNAHREECKQRQKKWREENHEYAKNLCREYYKTHIEKEREYYQNKMGRFCKEEKELVENYEKAKADNFKGWVRHHRLETHNTDGNIRLAPITRDELKALDMYYDRPAEELIWMRNEEHIQMHNKVRGMLKC